MTITQGPVVLVCGMFVCTDVAVAIGVLLCPYSLLTVILRPDFGRRISRNVSGKIAASVALSREPRLLAKMPHGGKYLRRIPGDPSANTRPQDDSYLLQ